MGLNSKAPVWTPGPSSSGDRREDSLDRIRRAVHGVDTHKSVGGAETLGVGGLNLPMKKTRTGLTYTARASNKRYTKNKLKGAGGNGKGAGLNVGLQGQQHV